MSTFRDLDREAVDIVLVARHKRSHEGVRVMCLQVCGPIRDKPVASRVGFVETVVGEFFQLVPEFLHITSICIGVLYGTFDELWLYLLHHLNVLLSDRLTQSVGLSAGEHRQVLGYLHELLLVYQDAVCARERVLHFRMQIVDTFFTVFTFDEAVYELHGSGPVKRDHGDNVFEYRRFEFFQVTFHACGFELEYTRGVAALEQLVGLLVVQRNFR